MAYTSDMIQKFVAAGYTAGLVSGQKVVRLYICHKCKRKSMVKFYGGDRRYNACKCGYRKSF